MKRNSTWGCRRKWPRGNTPSTRDTCQLIRVILIPGPSPHLPFLSLKVFILHAVSNENHSLISHTFCYEWPGLEIGSWARGYVVNVIRPFLLSLVPKPPSFLPSVTFTIIHVFFCWASTPMCDYECKLKVKMGRLGNEAIFYWCFVNATTDTH